MRILWHSASPDHPTGYGKQTAIWASYLASRGHDVAISAYAGLEGKMFGFPAHVRWADHDGEVPVLPVYPSPLGGSVHDLLLGHAKMWKPDLVVILADIWQTPAPLVRMLGVPTVCWTPVDCTPIGQPERRFFNETGATPLAMSKHGLGEMERAGLAAHYIPHGIDTKLFAPPADRAALRQALEVEGRFVVGINATNIDAWRKAWVEQLRAFARFKKDHPSAILLAHTVVQWQGATDLLALARQLGLEQGRDVRWADQYMMRAGLFPDSHMAAWYGACDVVMNATYGEGFGLAAVEAQACGTPVILARNSSGPELVGPGWLVGCEPEWNRRYESWWGQPKIDELVRALNKAYERAGSKRDAARAFAEPYDMSVVAPGWDELLGSL